MIFASKTAYKHTFKPSKTTYYEKCPKNYLVNGSFGRYFRLRKRKL